MIILLSLLWLHTAIQTHQEALHNGAIADHYAETGIMFPGGPYSEEE